MRVRHADVVHRDSPCLTCCHIYKALGAMPSDALMFFCECGHTVMSIPLLSAQTGTGICTSRGRPVVAFCLYFETLPLSIRHLSTFNIQMKTIIRHHQASVFFGMQNKQKVA